MSHLPGWMEGDSVPFKTDRLFTSGTFHIIFSDVIVTDRG